MALQLAAVSTSSLTPSQHISEVAVPTPALTLYAVLTVVVYGPCTDPFSFGAIRTHLYGSALEVPLNGMLLATVV